MKNIFLIIFLGVLLAIGGVWLYASPFSMRTPTQNSAQQPRTLSVPRPQSSAATVGVVTVTPAIILINTPTQVTVSIQITGTAPISNSVNLLRLGPTGTQPTILGVMQSNGSGTYTLQPTFNETTTGQVQLQVSAAFRGQLTRVVSQTTSLAVWGVLSDATSGFTTLFPPTLYLTNTSTPGIFFLDSSPNGVAIGDAPGPNSPEATSGFRVVISATPYTVSGGFDINQYLLTQYPNSVVDLSSIASTTIGGQPGYEFTFQNEEGGGKPVVMVYYSGYVYEMRYASTNYVAGFSDQAGVNAFNSVVQNFSFN